jgi:hypothetical protein
VPEIEQTPSTDAAAVDAVAAEPVSTEASITPQPNFWRRLFGKHPGQPAESKADADGASEEPATPQEPSTFTLTREELDRRIQAETDRREAKRQREDAERAERERREAIQRKLTPGSPEYDPYAGAEEQDRLRQEEQTAEQFTSFLGDIGKQHDAVTLDVITAAVPKPELERIMKLEGAGQGLDGRKLIASESLKALEKHWKAEGQRAAEQRLREDPIFRKRVFAEHRDQVDEPELLPANGAPRSGDAFMDQVFSDYRAAKGRRR